MLTKIIEKNLKETVEVQDLYGNKTDVEYNVYWIDKDPPNIKIEKEKQNDNSIKIKFTELQDNNGIRKIEYVLNEKIIHIEEGENLFLPKEFTYNNLNKHKENEIKITVTDFIGNKSYIIEKISL